mgnify:FL=1
MAEIQDYTSGSILEMAKTALAFLHAGEGSLQGTELGHRILHEAEKFAPLLLDMRQASECISEASFCAVGRRMCCELGPEADATEAVFLNELGEAMVEAGKAVRVSAEEAVGTLKRYKGKPLVFSKVGGKHMEICRTQPATCLYWNMKRRGLNCLKSFRAP